MKAEQIKDEILLREEYEKYLQNEVYKLKADVQISIKNPFQFTIDVNENQYLSFDEWKKKYYEYK